MYIEGENIQCSCDRRYKPETVVMVNERPFQRETANLRPAPVNSEVFVGVGF
jgi:hypothetical protein